MSTVLVVTGDGGRNAMLLAEVAKKMIEEGVANAIVVPVRDHGKSRIFTLTGALGHEFELFNAPHAEPEKPQITYGPPRKGKKGKVKRW